MIADLKPYPEYKETGLAWIGQVPVHWETRVLKRLCSRSALYGANIPASDYIQAGVRFLRTTDITDEGTLRRGGVFVDQNARKITCCPTAIFSYHEVAQSVGLCVIDQRCTEHAHMPAISCVSFRHLSLAQTTFSISQSPWPSLTSYASARSHRL